MKTHPNEQNKGAHRILTRDQVNELVTTTLFSVLSVAHTQKVCWVCKKKMKLGRI